MRPEQLPKPEHGRKKRPPAGAANRANSSGTAAGMPLFLKGVQAKLKKGQRDDAFERHADQIAGAAVSRDLDRGTATPALQTSGSSEAAIPAADAGSPIPRQVRERAEPALDADLSHVRVHEADADRKMAGGIGARAFTHGQHIWMGPNESSSDLKLMAHEAAHVAQQSGAAGAPSIQRQPQQTAAAGTTDQMVLFVNNPGLETDASLRTVLTMLNRYKPTVDLAGVDFQVMTSTPSYVGAGLFEDGRSHWDGAKPVIELTQEKYDTIAQHLAGTAAIADVHSVIRTVGHELYHLYREKTGNQANPIEPLFKAEATKRMEEIHQNWVNFAKDPGGAKALGIPKGTSVTKWEDIPAAERKKIEEGASQTSVIQGLYERTAYLVEETYVKIEELSYLRVQQKAETGSKRPSLASVSQLANLVYRFNTALDQSVGQDYMTAELLAKTKTAMLEYLRKRYPHPGDASVDSYEVIFYLTSKGSGLPPLYDDSGALISVKPAEARVP
jgi:Domain of unknown function (DUF4157)